MARIRSKDTKPELIVRRYLYSRGYRFRKNYKGLPGTPDVVMKKYGVAIFIHGCFWHGHDDSRLPKSNVTYWKEKIERNKVRDEENKESLKQMGWSVMTIWECQLKPAVRNQTLREMEYWINKSYLDRQNKSRNSKTYVLREDDTMKVAAEKNAVYRKNVGLEDITLLVSYKGSYNGKMNYCC